MNTANPSWPPQGEEVVHALDSLELYRHGLDPAVRASGVIGEHVRAEPVPALPRQTMSAADPFWPEGDQC